LTFSKRFGFLDAGKDIGGAIASTELMMVYGVTMGYALVLNTLILDNPIVRQLNRWLNLSDKMHLVKISMSALADREKTPEARPDMVSQWIQNHAQNPQKMSTDEIKAGNDSYISL
jgi:cytochrome P450